MRDNIRLTLIFILFISFSYGQNFTQKDSLFGSITPERAWWDVLHYELQVDVLPETFQIKGTNKITYKVLEPNQLMQIDLQEPMTIEKVTQNGKELKVTSEGMFHYIRLEKRQRANRTYTLEVSFSGKPRTAKRPPWDGGFSWERDPNDKHFIATSNQGIGSSIWWPNKDHPYDEPDNGLDLHIGAPGDLVAVGNGRLIGKAEENGTTLWHWRVINPINNYGVNINIGDYVNFSEVYQGLNGPLDLDYWVLRDNLSKAREQFKQVPKMIEAFEHWFGPYPFYEDSFKLVEVPYLGMEHQSSVTYGNRYMNGYLGGDLSRSGWGLKFDFIIIHEGGHEWFANNITNKDVADMWIHEGFTAYSENLYLDYWFGKQAASEYVIGTRVNIANDRPLIGVYGVRNSGSSDMYYKGANILHTLRQLIENDDKWKDILHGLNRDFRHQTISSAQLEAYISEKSGIDLTEFWQQYLRTTMVPTIEYRIEGSNIEYRYVNIIDKFDMPVIAIVNGVESWIYPTAEWQKLSSESEIESFEVKKDFYVKMQSKE